MLLKGHAPWESVPYGFHQQKGILNSSCLNAVWGAMRALVAWCRLPLWPAAYPLPGAAKRSSCTYKYYCLQHGMQFLQAILVRRCESSTNPSVCRGTATLCSR